MDRKGFLSGLIALMAAPKSIALELVKDAPLVETKVNHAVAYAKFSKQILRNLPFLQNCLPEMILIDFEKEESLGLNNFLV